MNPWMVSEMPVIDPEGVETCVVFWLPPVLMPMTVDAARALAEDLNRKADEIDPPPRTWSFRDGWLAASVFMIALGIILAMLT